MWMNREGRAYLESKGEYANITIRDRYPEGFLILLWGEKNPCNQSQKLHRYTSFWSNTAWTV